MNTNTTITSKPATPNKTQSQDASRLSPSSAVHRPPAFRQRIALLCPALFAATTALATVLPADAWYADTFTISTGTTHAPGSALAKNSTPQINTTGTDVGWSGFNPQLMLYNTAANGVRNTDAATGVISMTRSDTNVLSALLPVQASFTAQSDTFSVGIDLIPAPSDSNNTNAQQWGLVFTQGSGQNFFNATGNVRIGIGRTANGGDYIIRAAVHNTTSGTTNTTWAIPATASFSATDWNSLRVDYTPATYSFSIYLNNTFVATWASSATTVSLSYLGFEAGNSSSVNVTGYFDNFYVAPFHTSNIPESSTLALAGGICVLGFILFLRIRRRFFPGNTH
ncbi:MAG: hypothetical protein LBK99_23800 [Opitutaceae bacterium]|nr:hypothetical protein [Opitutaceae bacterium]